MKVLLLWLLAVFIAPTALAGQRLVYQLDQFPMSINLVYDIEDSRITARLKASYFGMQAGSVTELTELDGDNGWSADSRCRAPKAQDRGHNCYSSVYRGDGDVLLRQYSGEGVRLDSQMMAGDRSVERHELKLFFPEFDASMESIHNPSTLLLLAQRPDFGLQDNGRILYLTGGGEFYKGRLKVTQKSPQFLDVKVDVLASHNSRPDMQDTFPGRFIYDVRRKLVKSIYLTVKNGEYILELVSPK